MSKLSDFILKLTDDTNLQQRYTKNPEAVMTEFGLSDQEKAALRSGDEDKVFSAIGKPAGTKFFKLILAGKS